MFTKILVANRGEIAVRIFRTCADLGVAAVAVHSSADAGALHVRTADEAVDLGDGPASENYLNIAKIVQAAVDHGAEAVHPGYGFLAENAAFAQAVTDAGLVFIGPSAHAITTMGEKVAARAVAAAAAVPLLPGSAGAVADEDEVTRFGEAHGYPLLIKASFGGGGRGMRQVPGPDEVTDAYASAVREATAAFGDGEVYVERFLVDARHVEVQVFGDSYANAVYLGDRDCSVQRRHQKLIEEAPAAGLSDAMRAAMGEAALRLVREVGYVGAGTVEFLVEGESFYFLEMNTRIQVEHPVTELVTGMDLIAEQLRVAAGEPLSRTESGVTNGAAIEARINAEDPAGGLFRPAPGPIYSITAPQGEHLRWDAGYESGDEVLPLYDSLVGKLIAWGPDRDTAIDTLLVGLDGLKIEGIATTVSAAAHILATEDFRSANISTRWLETSVTLPEPEPAEEPLGRDEVYVQGRYFRIPVFSDGVRSGAVVTAAHEDSGNGERRSTARRGPGRTKVAGDGTLKAPMQGTIVEVKVAAGDSVVAGQLLFVLEAMKMENPIHAPHDGVISTVSVAQGDSLPAGSLLAEYAEAV
ncbi:acetyl/propionyl/methylcrotonyl-CoA carboxylase subunit alpha [Occultella gossypii]|uniref:biotin carboxylase n=1 Tax=Occultella gossypii TaxID=2800820 RepID=A0ABS7S531_9MICO|nr:biotin carboxylase N-terminal domain-containing protein [Occultella gossypii]MBZ2195454.1 ATP-grasp domain-containing protein [Occultella gossypii]